jgi:hypothetical protein
MHVRAKYAALRRHGRRVTASVVAKTTETIEIPTADGLPEITETRTYLTVRWKPTPPVQISPPGCMLYPRWSACKWHCRRICRRTSSSASKKKQPWQQYMGHDGVVQYKVHVSRATWEKADLTVRLVYDPWDDTNWVLPEVRLAWSTALRLYLSSIILSQPCLNSRVGDRQPSGKKSRGALWLCSVLPLASRCACPPYYYVICVTVFTFLCAACYRWLCLYHRRLSLRPTVLGLPSVL